jgi:hypothetical protein
MRTEADARRDPRPGDVLRVSGKIAEVLSRPIYHGVSTAKKPRLEFLAYWQNWTEDAEVLKVAQS